MRGTRGTGFNVFRPPSEYLHDVLPLDFLTAMGALKAYFRKKAFVTHKHKFIIDSNLYQKILLPYKIKSLVVFTFPIDAEYQKWIWLTFFAPKNKFFTEEQLLNFEQLWYEFGFKRVFESRMIKSNHHPALTSAFTPHQWQTVKDISIGNDVDKGRTATIDKKLQLHFEDENEKVKRNTIHAIQASIQQHPLIHWLSERAYRPQGDRSLLSSQTFF